MRFVDRSRGGRLCPARAVVGAASVRAQITWSFGRRLTGTLSFVAAIVSMTGSIACSGACHDELNVSVFVDLGSADGKDCDVTLANGSRQLVYHCPSGPPACVDDEGEHPCTPMNDTPRLIHCERQRCAFTLMTLNETEAEELRNALGGSQFSVAVTCEGVTVLPTAASGQVETQKCEG